MGKDEVTPRMIAKVLTKDSDEVLPSTAKDIGKLTEKVVNDLHLEDFIGYKWDIIEGKLLMCDKYAESAKTFGSNMMFLNMAIPLVNGIIHIGSTRDLLTETTQKMIEGHQKLRLSYDPQRIPAISTLVLIYLIVKGWNKNTKALKAAQSGEYSEEELKKLKEEELSWGRMLSRAQRLYSDKPGR